MDALLAQTFLNSLVLSMSLALVALGIALVYGILEIVNLAHGELYMFGAFIFWFISTQAGIHPIFGVLGAMIGAALLAAILERLAFRPIRGQMTQGFIACMGIILILQTTAQLIFGIQAKAVPYFPGFTGVISIGAVTFSAQRILVIIIGLAGIAVLSLFLRFNKWGKGLQAIAQDAEAAALQGISINKGSVMAMVIGGALAGLAGAVLAPLSYVEPFMGGGVILKALVAIVIGGIGSFPGTIIACFIWGFVEGFGSAYLDSSVAYAIMYGLLILIILWRPLGLMGRGLAQ